MNEPSEHHKTADVHRRMVELAIKRGKPAPSYQRTWSHSIGLTVERPNRKGRWLPEDAIPIVARSLGLAE
jgi:hypothetical protein